MKKLFITCMAFAFCTAASAQDNFSFWKKDRAYAKNSFSINTGGPSQSVGFQFDHHELSGMGHARFTRGIRC